MYHVFKKAVCRAKSGGCRWPADGKSSNEENRHFYEYSASKRATLGDRIDYGFEVSFTRHRLMTM